ncbi:DNA protecting protein DprA [Orientia chuto str. Dubai]|uniref:DNA protecting protein DprA n=1 Tax=Orientia chuto str. Dubai TaxID=1359168 RepID=A0A0F3MNV5_9RICK|nr:DNA-processing protein DprA [Candidatus Orientia mediorientalis]KJV56269.1 DNA protecting protein DprA [Orientia chuto str. Dubai]
MFKGTYYNSCSSASYDEEKIFILRLARSENVGPRTFFELIRLFGSAKTALQYAADFSLKGGKKRPIKTYTNLEALQEIELLEKINAHLLTYRDSEYSKLLLHIPDHPPVITYKGNIKLLNHIILAVVGSRNASLNGIVFTKNIVKNLIDNKIIVVSGLARGIDTAAHQSALPHTIAVIAGGIDHIYPQENIDLYHKIANEGLILAELPINSPPLSKHFPQRNRIIAGISYGTLVIEASLRSGSLITARLALEYNRELFAVPGFPYDPRYQGTNQLLKNGAYLVENIDDIIEQLPAYNLDHNSNCYDQENLEQYTSTYKPTIISNVQRETVKNMLSSVPLDIEVIVKQTELPTSVVNIIILELELAGIVVRCSGNKIVLLYN